MRLARTETRSVVVVGALAVVLGGCATVQAVLQDEPAAVIPAAVDVTGTWNGVSFTSRSATPIVLTVTQEGALVTGTYAAPSDPTQSGAVTGVVRGTTLQFAAPTGDTLDLAVSGDQMSGTSATTGAQVQMRRITR